MIDIRAKRPGFHVYKHEGDFVLIDVNSGGPAELNC